MARAYLFRGKSLEELHRHKTMLLRLLTLPTQAIRASVVETYGTCGKRSCHCHRGEGDRHGPYFYLTQCVAKGQVRKFLLKTPQAQQRAREAVSAFRCFYDTLDELSQVNAELLRRGDGDPSSESSSVTPVPAPQGGRKLRFRGSSEEP